MKSSPTNLTPKLDSMATTKSTKSKLSNSRVFFKLAIGEISSTSTSNSSIRKLFILSIITSLFIFNLSLFLLAMPNLYLQIQKNWTKIHQFFYPVFFLQDLIWQHPHQGFQGLCWGQ